MTFYFLVIFDARGVVDLLVGCVSQCTDSNTLTHLEKGFCSLALLIND